MSMEHKAFIFDTVGFNKELREIIIAAGITNDTGSLKSFITENMGRVRSVYTGDLLNAGWEEELENGGVQELSDFAMTLYYSLEEDSGLYYAWDSLIEALQVMSTRFHPEYYILGRALKSGAFRLDPGGMGMGFVYAEDIPFICNELIHLKRNLSINGLPLSNDVIYETPIDELIEAYDELIRIYEEANAAKCGLLMTF
ncbi:hypothetical protein BBG47_27705 [Paenibacillus sp. KS1]|uniref:hypothetical protein n=1 Tax=Paenibacillus sp. KS1 TaxID=1849249 RepID=UPI000806453A|nr:hypothetical protein [Paenibacillus sp. KS1]OBY76343.1 hypothetical protein BBG47_27705 [Paenibacillus sp. KS1]